MVGSEADVGIGRQMEHKLTASHRRGQEATVEEVPLNQLESGRVFRESDKLRLACRVIIESDNLIPPCEKAVDKVAADKAHCSGDECLHVSFLIARGTAVTSGTSTALAATSRDRAPSSPSSLRQENATGS